MGTFQRLEQRPRLDRLKQVWQRIFDPSIDVSIEIEDLGHRS